MSTGVGVRLFIDGQRFADGCPVPAPGEPVALSGLSVTWGRETTVDQPEASTCTFEVQDALGGSSFTDYLRVGRTVDVFAVGTVYPDPDMPVWPDPGFETGTAATITTSAAATVSTRRTYAGTYALRIAPTRPARRATVTIAPAPFAAPGDDPSAWDHIHATAPGQRWRMSADVFAGPGAIVRARPALFSGPWRSAVRVLPEPVAIVAGDATWQRVELSFTPDAAGAWVGLEVSTYPTGPAWSDLDPGMTWTDVDPEWAWTDYGDVYVDNVRLYAPGGGIEESVLVFAGRVTALEETWPDDEPAPVVQVTCADFTADLENVQVGDEPWAVESLADRFARILALSGLDITADIDPDLGAYLVTWRDVDAQAVTGLLVELAESVDGVLWSATHATTGPYFVLEDPTTRTALYVLDLVDGRVVIVPTDRAANQLSACDVLRDEVTWTQDVQDLITRTVVTWQEQDTDDEGKPTTTDRTVTRIDRAAEVAYGRRRLALSTQLQTSVDAAVVAERLLSRTSDLDWRASGLTIDDADLTGTEPEDVRLLLTLLDGTSRNGLPLQLVDLPSWAPADQRTGVNLEGGQYTFDEGAWVLSLDVSNYAGQGASALWNQLPAAWAWADVDYSITWADLEGVGPPTTNLGA